MLVQKRNKIKRENNYAQVSIKTTHTPAVRCTVLPSGPVVLSLLLSDETEEMEHGDS